MEARTKAVKRAEEIVAMGKGARQTDADEWRNIMEEVADIDTQLRAIKTDRVKTNAPNADFDSYGNGKEEKRSVIGQLFRYMADPNAKDIAPEIRALNSTGGSATIQDPNVSDDIIYRLSQANPLQSLGAQFLNLENNTQWPAVTANPTAYWVAEGSEVTVDSALTITGRKIEYKDLAVRIRVSNQLLRDASGRAERLIENAAIMALDEAIQKAIYHGTGAGNNQPLGFIVESTQSVLSGVTEIDNAGAAYDFGTIVNAYKQLMDNNVPLDRIGLVTNPAVWAYINKVQDQNNQYIIPPVDLNKTMWKYTSAISTTMDSSTTTCAILGQWDQLAIGFEPVFTIKADQPRSGYLETEFVFWTRVDLEVLNPSAFAVLHSLPLT